MTSMLTDKTLDDAAKQVSSWSALAEFLDLLPAEVDIRLQSGLRYADDVPAWQPVEVRDCDCDYPGPGCPTRWFTPYGVLYTDCVGMFDVETRQPTFRGSTRMELQVETPLDEPWSSMGMSDDRPDAAAWRLLSEARALMAIRELDEARLRRSPERAALAEQVKTLAIRWLGDRRYFSKEDAELLGDTLTCDVSEDVLEHVWEGRR